MDYFKTYWRLIWNAIDRDTDFSDYVERHHIIPKSEGGTNEDSNLVKLSAREHYIAHLLLAKIYGDWKMHNALMIMRAQTDKH